jgi:predicted NUDIX family NTP pyrophosphohydrolase
MTRQCLPYQRSFAQARWPETPHGHKMKRSAGILLFNQAPGGPRVLLVHPGGPFWAKKDAGAWSIPKGEYEPSEDALRAAIREFGEETGMAPEGDFHSLGEIVQKSGKAVRAWACKGDFDPAKLVSNLCEIEWPPRSGKRLQIPEADRAEWFSIDEARIKLNPAQVPFLDRLAARLASVQPDGK